MDDQRNDRKGGGHLKRAARSLLLSILTGALVFGILFGLMGLGYALNAGPEIPNKGGKPYTVLEWVSGQFFGGLILGIILGAIGWSILGVINLLKKLFRSS
jgi:hypothetical protein